MSIPTTNRRVLISGASIAGPALAYCLEAYGFTPTIVERSPSWRAGGYKIDVRGAAVDVLKQMGIYEQVRQASVEMVGASFVNKAGESLAEMPADFIGMRQGEDVELMRGDLSKVLYELTVPTCEYLFDESIRTIRESDSGVEVHFERSGPRYFDLVVGADGIHSNVRSLVFGPEANFVQNLGDYYFALFSIPNYLGLDRRELFYCVPGKVVNIYSTKGSPDAKALLLFKQPGFTYDYRDVPNQKRLVADLFAGLGWQVPALLEWMKRSTDFYFDTVEQIKMTSWSKGRTVLVGDAAYAPSLASGQGSSMALVGAYILAGELAKADGEFSSAFLNYERQLRGYVEMNQKLGENVHQMVPASRLGYWLQLRLISLMNYLPLKGLILKKISQQVRESAQAITFDPYVDHHNNRRPHPSMKP